MVDLRRSLRASETAEDARVLLERLRNRPDVYARIADETEELIISANLQLIHNSHSGASRVLPSSDTARLPSHADTCGRVQMRRRQVISPR